MCIFFAPPFPQSQSESWDIKCLKMAATTFYSINSTHFIFTHLLIFLHKKLQTSLYVLHQDHPLISMLPNAFNRLQVKTALHQLVLGAKVPFFSREQTVSVIGGSIILYEAATFWFDYMCKERTVYQRQLSTRHQ